MLTVIARWCHNVLLTAMGLLTIALVVSARWPANAFCNLCTSGRDSPRYILLRPTLTSNRTTAACRRAIQMAACVLVTGEIIPARPLLPHLAATHASRTLISSEIKNCPCSNTPGTKLMQPLHTQKSRHSA